MDVVVITGAISRTKLQSNHYHQQTNIHFFTAGCPSCRPTNSVKVLKGKISHSMYLLTPTRFEKAIKKIKGDIFGPMA